ncbi:MAG: hypothetical protein JNJ92_00010 [Altererythrobacter sp.]|nr:hypothetical protein [Altererythrobacter sp.]
MRSDLASVRKRKVFERKALQYMRGEKTSPDASDLPANTPSLRVAHFGCLRTFALRNELKVLPPGSQYLSPGELLILRWLAEAQRQVGPHTCCIDDPGFKSTLRHCAAILRDVGVYLPTRTLYISRDGPPPGSGETAVSMGRGRIARRGAGQGMSRLA